MKEKTKYRAIIFFILFLVSCSTYKTGQVEVQKEDQHVQEFKYSVKKESNGWYTITCKARVLPRVGFLRVKYWTKYPNVEQFIPMEYQTPTMAINTEKVPKKFVDVYFKFQINYPTIVKARIITNGTDGYQEVEAIIYVND